MFNFVFRGNTRTFLKSTTTLIFSFVLASCNPGEFRSLLVTPETTTLANGKSVQLNAFAATSAGQITNATQNVTWTSSDPSVVEISPTGFATARKAGNADITAHIAASATNATARITVTNAEIVALSISPGAADLAKGRSQQFTAAATFSDGLIGDVTAQVTWSASNTSVATISTEGLLNALNTGTATIRAELGAATAELDVRVTNAKLTQVLVESQHTMIPVGVVTRLKATGVFSDSTSQDLTSFVSWTVGDPLLGTISNMGFEHGTFLATAPGSAVLTAVDPISGMTGSTIVTVSPLQLERIEVRHAGLRVLSLAKGESTPLAAIGIYSNQTTSDITSQVVWSSSNSTTATVSPSGMLTGTNSGTATVRATFGAISGEKDALVTAAEIRSVTIAGPGAPLQFGENAAIKAFANYSDGSMADVTSRVVWASASSTALLVSNEAGNKGLLWMGRATGPTAITATLGTLVGTATIQTSNPSVPGPFYSTSAGTGVNPIPKGVFFRVKASVSYVSAFRDLVEISDISVSNQSSGVTTTLLTTPGLKGQLLVNGPTGGSFVLRIVLPFSLGSTTATVVLP